MTEINFLHPKFNSSIRCNCVAEDDYQPSNLVSSDSAEQERGFMAYKILRSPVELDIQLKYVVEVTRIKLWTRIDSMRSTGCTIYVIAENRIVQVARCTHVDADIVEFRLDGCETPTNSSCYQAKFMGNNSTRLSLKNASEIRVVLFPMRGRPPVLRKIEIWGLPSKESNETSVRECEELWQKITTPAQRTRKRKLSTEPQETNQGCGVEEDIPEEFLDAITCEIMAFPMRLPSGKAVDQSTIEKHSKNEESWGRSPCDPFTGKVFTAVSKPILDASLKLRIDKYVIESGRSQYFGVPRTVGRRNSDNLREVCSSSSNDEPLTKPSEPITSRPTKTIPVIIPLDEAMKNALSSIRQLSAKSSCDNTKNKCRSCGTNLLLYRINSCGDTVCKHCLNKFMDSKICLCSKPFSTSDVERFNK